MSEINKIKNKNFLRDTAWKHGQPYPRRIRVRHVSDTDMLGIFPCLCFLDKDITKSYEGSKVQRRY